MRAAAKTVEAAILAKARKEARKAKSWADFANFLFSPGGLLIRSFPEKADRSRFIKTSEYKAIRKLLEEVQERTGLIEGANPTKSGRFVVRLPKSMHSALEFEAAREGVSLNQLVVAMLASKLGGGFTTITAT